MDSSKSSKLDHSVSPPPKHIYALSPCPHQSAPYDDKPLPGRYAELPHKGRLFNSQIKVAFHSLPIAPCEHQLIISHLQQERKYFDSGDFALIKASKTSDTGLTIQTGLSHPQVENISSLSSPVPSNSNVKQNADRPYSSESKDRSLTVESGSHLHEEEKGDEKQE